MIPISKFCTVIRDLYVVLKMPSEPVEHFFLHSPPLNHTVAGKHNQILFEAFKIVEIKRKGNLFEI